MCTETHPFKLPNFMLILRVVALGTFFRLLILNTDEKVRSDDPNEIDERTMHEVCNSFHKTLSNKVDELDASIGSGKFTFASLSPGSDQMRLTANKIIVLVFPSGIDKKLNSLDRSIQSVKTDCECFPIYSWVDSNKIHTYIILKAEAPFEMIKMMCLNKKITNEHLNLYREMKIFHNKWIHHFLRIDFLLSSKCIPVFVEKMGQRNGWLIRCIMKGIRQNQESETSPAHQMFADEPEREHIETTVGNRSNLRKRKNPKTGNGKRTEPTKKRTQASPVKLPDQEDGTSSLQSSNSQATVHNQSGLTLPNDAIASSDEEKEEVPEDIVEQQHMEEESIRETSCTKMGFSVPQTSCQQDPSLAVGATPSSSGSSMEEAVLGLDKCNPHDSERKLLLGENDCSRSCVINVESDSSAEQLPVPAEKRENIL
ncbi:uncharacterized protein LOC114520041 [Dendronephthya gigantea]|uniref:uncharacterized protein LOC114520041 n=1 Tax=Dendronephthya gigantea TaxID=151771 RepID=UPI0010697EFF|nr:uncharacterized protein LOC114520041 [Dendronephthya gigantea]